MKPFRVIGLTGGIASGKSAAARFFAEAGIPVLDADQVARELREAGGAGYEAILKRFGTADRSKLREIVFTDPQARKDLEALMHPLIRKESERRMALLAKPGSPVIYEAALLVETGRYRELGGLIVVEAPREVRRERMIQRDHATPEMADQILNAQTSDELRRAAATHVLMNDGSLDELRAKVLALIPQL